MTLPYPWNIVAVVVAICFLIIVIIFVGKSIWDDDPEVKEYIHKDRTNMKYKYYVVVEKIYDDNFTEKYLVPLDKFKKKIKEE